MSNGATCLGGGVKGATGKEQADGGGVDMTTFPLHSARYIFCSYRQTVQTVVQPGLRLPASFLYLHHQSLGWRITTTIISTSTMGPVKCLLLAAVCMQGKNCSLPSVISPSVETPPRSGSAIIHDKTGISRRDGSWTIRSYWCIILKIHLHSRYGTWKCVSSSGDNVLYS